MGNDSKVLGLSYQKDGSCQKLPLTNMGNTIGRAGLWGKIRGLEFEMFSRNPSRDVEWAVGH